MQGLFSKKTTKLKINLGCIWQLLQMGEKAAK
jgi:hypothetical protein